MTRLPSFSALRAFDAVARMGSFKDAATSLDISTSAISHQIRSLEDDLGQSLFERRSTGIVLTDEAKKYLECVKSAFDQLEKGTNTIRKNEPTSSLRISLLSSLSTLWLIPRLEHFGHDHPDINVELVDGSDLVDFRAARADAAIRYDFLGKGGWGELITHPLLNEYVFPVCAPAYLERFPEIAHSAWNNKHSLLANSRHPDEWDQWCQAAGTHFRLSNHATSSIMDTSNMTLMAATSGLGVALGRTPFVDRFLATQELVRIHNKAQARGMRHFLVYPERNKDNPELTRFRNWLLDTASQCNLVYSEQYL